MKIGFREILFLLLLTAIPIGAYCWVFKPANLRIESQRRDIEAKVQKLASLRTAMVGIENLNEEVAKLKEAVGFFEAKLPQHHEIHRVLEQVTKIVKRHRLETKSFKTLKPQMMAAYAEQPIKMEVGGDFNAYYQFLLELEKLPRITKVKDMKLEKTENKEFKGLMKSDMELVIFFDESVVESSSAK
ncbi:MAG: hypothetical protein AMJ79_04020 [Phycisphaerae bacterium SM23_30]|nr:MAG: hypothetical protein AMJ79_04020 [Phycisphaerae bacterium SM23_30]